ncbi:hypothetical protein A5779_17825 [Mycolicibacterium peregrinum]|uniref:Uncharacterized protein n=1 Tax=Mycolicibacterium peregrinum TaxID=43304 RepID=A0A1A0WD14_MYCPR|nr:hypothetical protein A5779_17825 [Mycolicibacterium peregrinum]
MNDAWLTEAALEVPRAYGKSRTCSAAERAENHLLLDQLNALVEEVHEIINRQMAGSAPSEQCANVAAQVDEARHHWRRSTSGSTRLCVASSRSRRDDSGEQRSDAQIFQQD